MKSLLILCLIPIIQLVSNIKHNLDFLNIKLLNQSEGNQLNSIIKGDLSYTNDMLSIQIAVGKPPQRFNLFIDLGGNYMFLPGQNAVNQTPITNFFDRNSETFMDSQRSVSKNSNLGNCKGTYVTSLFELYASLIPSYEWILCSEIKMIVLDADGMIGFNRAINEDTSISTLLSRLFYRDANLPHKVISFRPATKAYPSPQLFIGNYDRDFSLRNVARAYHTLTIFPSNPNSWAMSNIDLVFGDYSYPFNVVNKSLINAELYFTSQITYHNFPFVYINYFLNYFPKDCHRVAMPNLNQEMIDCPNKDLVANFSIQMNNSLVLFPKSTLWRKNPATQEDRLNILFIKYSYLMFIGLDFFKHYHILFSHENNRVIFHPLNDGKVTDLNYDPSKPVPDPDPEPSPDPKPEPKPEPDLTRDSYFWGVLGIIIGVIVIGIIITSTVLLLQRQNQSESFHINHFFRDRLINKAQNINLIQNN